MLTVRSLLDQAAVTDD